MEVLIFVHHFLSEDSNFAPSDWILWSLVSFPPFWQEDDLSPKYLTCSSLRTEMTPISTTRYWWWKSDINNVKQQKLLVQLLFFLSLMRKVKYPSFALGIYILQALPIKVHAKSKEGVSSVQSCLTLCDPMNCSMLGLPVYHQLPEFTQTHVQWVGDAI